MKRIKTIETRDLKKSVKTGGCGECQPAVREVPREIRISQGTTAVIPQG